MESTSLPYTIDVYIFQQHRRYLPQALPRSLVELTCVAHDLLRTKKQLMPQLVATPRKNHINDYFIEKRYKNIL